jgi:hypothetical protein
MDMDLSYIAQALDRIRRWGGQLEVFGANVHHFECYPPLTEPDLKLFEAEHKIRLPAGYRTFLLQVGNGGAGPAYGVFRLGEMDDGFEYKKWHEQDFMVGTLAVPFPHVSPWNDLTGMPADEGLDEDERDRQLEAFDRVYFLPLDGTLPVCHRGCALRVWLVVSGPEAGHIWFDDRADCNGLYPYSLPGLERVSFSQWYRAWLDDILQSHGIGD